MYRRVAWLTIEFIKWSRPDPVVHLKVNFSLLQYMRMSAKFFLYLYYEHSFNQMRVFVSSSCFEARLAFFNNFSVVFGDGH